MERKEQAFGQQRVLHTEEVAALGARAAFVRKEQSSHVAAGAELRLAQRSESSLKRVRQNCRVPPPSRFQYAC